MRLEPWSSSVLGLSEPDELVEHPAKPCTSPGCQGTMRFNAMEGSDPSFRQQPGSWVCDRDLTHFECIFPPDPLSFVYLGWEPEEYQWNKQEELDRLQRPDQLAKRGRAERIIDACLMAPGVLVLGAILLLVLLLIGPFWAIYIIVDETRVSIRRWRWNRGNRRP